MPDYQMSRRTFTATASGFAAGIFAASRTGASVLTQQATPAGSLVPVGFVSMRLRTVATAGQRDAVNGLVLEDLVPGVETLDGYQGYLLGDVLDASETSLSVLVMDEASQTAAFDELAGAFVQGISDQIEVVETVEWSGDLLITGRPAVSTATPSATPAGEAAASGYVAVRVHTSLPGTDPHDFVPLATAEFLPIVEGLAGFHGYLWFPVEGGFAAITLYDSEASAEASNEAAREWAAEFLTDYTDGNPEVINATVVYADLPILG
jgi:hypothetical protein